MAKTKYTQTVKGDIAGAKRLARSGNLLLDLANISKQKSENSLLQRDSAYARIDKALNDETNLLLEGFGKAQKNYDKMGQSNEAELGDTLSSARLNRSRERGAALSALQALGGGETDRLKAQAASLRSFNINAQGGARSYEDALANLNASISDTNTQAKTNITNAANRADSNRQAAFNEQLSAQGTAFSEMLDQYGQAESLFNQASAAAETTRTTNTTSGSYKNQSSSQSQSAVATKLSKQYDQSAVSAAKSLKDTATAISDLAKISYEGKAKTAEELGFKDAAAKASTQNLNQVGSGGTLQKMTAPTGSKLRKA